MGKSLLLLSLVAFGVSFVLSLFAYGGIKQPLLAGLITVTATICGEVVINRKQITKEKLTLSALQHQIRQLEQWELELNQSLEAIGVEEERTEVYLAALQKELNQIYIQIDTQRRYKQQLTQDLAGLTAQSRQMEAEAKHQLSSISNLEQRRGELDVTVRSLKVEKYNIESGFNSLQIKLNQLQEQVDEQQNQKQELELNLSLLKRIKPQLETELHTLRTDLQELETRKIQLSESLESLVSDQQITEANINLLQAQLRELQGQIEQNNKLEPESIPSGHQTLQMGEDDEQQPENLNNRWAELVARLAPPELQVLQVIVQQDNPTAAIKKIAEENITMPEVLIAAINEHALATIGDIVINSDSVCPAIAEAEYLTNVQTILKINEVN